MEKLTPQEQLDLWKQERLNLYSLRWFAPMLLLPFIYPFLPHRPLPLIIFSLLLFSVFVALVVGALRGNFSLLRCPRCKASFRHQGLIPRRWEGILRPDYCRKCGVKLL